MPRETIITGNHVGLISSLPQWASREILRLDRVVVELEDRLRSVNWDPNSGQIEVPRGVRIALKGQARPDDIWLHFLSGGALEVSTHGMLVIPQAGNRVIISGQNTALVGIR